MLNRAEQEWPEGMARTLPSEIPLSRAELRTLFYPGRHLELIACLVPMAQPQMRIVKAQLSYEYDMQRADGKVSRLDFEVGQKIVGVSDAGNGFTAVKILMSDGEVAAHYRLL